MRKLLLIIFFFSLVACSRQQPAPSDTVDVVLIGGGIMSATLGTYIHELEPEWTISIFERLDAVAAESSNAWNNAGTGHSAFCELNYTPEKADGSIEIVKAVEINEWFEISKQFWAHQVKQNVLQNPGSFINNVPHMSFVWGDDNINYLKKRHAALQHSSLFRGMEYSEDPAQIQEWIPLVMAGRDPTQRIAATRMAIGTDVNFGEITRQLTTYLSSQPQVSLNLQHEVQDIKRNDDNTWTVTVANLANNSQISAVTARYVFIGAGGGALKLLQKSGIPEAEGYAGFPVGGQFLVTENPAIVAAHQAKVYGKASVGSPPMSVPHLDTRVIDGKKVLLFGPFATFSTKFLKEGSVTDLARSLTTDNILPMMHAGWDNIPLTSYLIGQLMLSDSDRMDSLREYFPQAAAQDWRLHTAGQRVQIIKNDPEHGGVLQFGTEIVSSEDGSIAALLGASPGASTAAPIMLNVLNQMFKAQIKTPQWQQRLTEIIPSYGQKLNNNLELTNSIRAYSSEWLQLKHVEVQEIQEIQRVQPEL
ncbi:malate:quinone oxidoreductase [Chromatiaceae bacterium AAb-1]|nr:malate:quinone oxidoreductase [Chromatiaceae bacterium AAb-1]